SGPSKPVQRRLGKTHDAAEGSLSYAGEPSPASSSSSLLLLRVLVSSSPCLRSRSCPWPLPLPLIPSQPLASSFSPAHPWIREKSIVSRPTLWACRISAFSLSSLSSS
ncbi:hypothetical protein H113_09070, partial [Trichophyton rubrum MR1459]